MTIPEMETLLEGVTGYTDKVTYWEWPVGQVPSLPYVCYFSQEEAVFAADNIAYYTRPRFSVELYTKNRDLTQEALFEAAFTRAGLYYQKESEYLEDERCQVTIFSL